MTHLMMTIALLAPTALAFADTGVPNEALAQAMVDRSESITKIKRDCSSGVSQVKSVKIEDGVYKHTFQLSRHFRGSPGKDCKVEITQDFRPTYYDAAIAYDIVVTEN